MLLRYVGRSDIKTMNSNYKPQCCPLPPQVCDATIALLFLLYMSSILMNGKAIPKHVPCSSHFRTCYISYFKPVPLFSRPSSCSSSHKNLLTQTILEKVPGLSTSMLRPDKLFQKCGCHVGYLLLTLMMHMASN